MKRIIFALLMVCSFSISAQAGVKGAPVSYDAGGVTMNGYIAYDDSTDSKRPGILVVHEWWGHNEYARKRQDQVIPMDKNQ